MAIQIIIRGADDSEIRRGPDGSDPGDMNPYRDRPADENGMKTIEEGDPLEDEVESPATAHAEDALGETDHAYDEAGDPHDKAFGGKDPFKSPSSMERRGSPDKKEEKKKPKSFFALMGYGGKK